MLHLIKMWVEAPVEETDERGNKRRSTRNRDEGRGSPQGSPISPLLSNLYMRRFVLGWKKLGHEKRLNAYIVNYADDLVICCRSQAEEALATMRDMMSKLKLTVNDTKTRVCKLPEEKFDFFRVYVRAMLLAQDGTGLLRNDSVEETGATHLQNGELLFFDPPKLVHPLLLKGTLFREAVKPSHSGIDLRCRFLVRLQVDRIIRNQISTLACFRIDHQAKNGTQLFLHFVILLNLIV